MFIGGGGNNSTTANSANSSIVGGANNCDLTNAGCGENFIGGGNNNINHNYTFRNVITGGFNNITKYFSKKFSKKLFIISEGVSQNFINNKKKLGDYLFFPAQLWPHKNHLTILRAVKILNDKYKKKNQNYFGRTEI